MLNPNITPDTNDEYILTSGALIVGASQLPRVIGACLGDALFVYLRTSLLCVVTLTRYLPNVFLLTN